MNREEMVMAFMRADPEYQALVEEAAETYSEDQLKRELKNSEAGSRWQMLILDAVEAQAKKGGAGARRESKVSWRLMLVLVACVVSILCEVFA